MMLRLTLRNLAAHKLRLLLTGLAVTLGVAFVAGTLIFTDTLEKKFDELFSSIGENVSVQVRTADDIATDRNGSDQFTRPIPQALVDRVDADVPGVAQAFGSVAGNATVIDSTGEPIGGQGPPTFGISWDPDTADQFAMTSGRVPAGDGQVALDARTAERAAVGVGDQVPIVLTGPVRTFTVSGIFDPGPAAGATFAAFDAETAQRLLVRPGHWTTITIKAEPGVNQEELRDRVAAVLPAGFEAITGKRLQEESESDLAQVLDFLNVFLLVFAAVSLFVGAFIIFNTFSMLVAQRTRELALLRAVGASRAQVSRAVLGEALAVGVVGATLGLGLGAALAVGLRALLRAFEVDLPAGDLVFAPTTAIAGYVIGIVVTTLAAYLPARRGARVPPVAAMRDDVVLPTRSLRRRLLGGSVLTAIGAAAMGVGLAGEGGRPALAVGAGAAAVFLGVAMLAPAISGPVVRVLAAPFPRLFAVAGRLGRRNALRNPRRTAATASALMIGLALVTTIAVLGASAKASIGAAIDRALGADFVIASRTFMPFTPEAVAAVRRAPQVDSVTPISMSQVRIEGRQATLSAGDPAGLAAAAGLRISAGSDRLGADSLLVDDETASERGWGVGRSVEVAFPDGQRRRLRVSGTFAGNELLGSYLVSPRLYAASFDDPRVQFIYVDSAAPGAQVRAALDQALAGYPTLRLLDQTEIKEENRRAVDSLIAFVTGLLVLSIIIAALGIINTLALSVIERTREIGLLRAVGLSRRQVRRMIRLEAVVVAVFGALLGVAIGVAFGWALQRTLAGDGLEVLSVPAAQLTAYVVVSGLIGMLAALWPAWRAGRMDVLRAVSTE